MRISDWSSDVCSSDLLVEGRAQLRHVVKAGVRAHMLVGVEHGHALAGLHLDGQDLALEPALRLRACGAAMALHGELVLNFAGGAIFARHIFRSDAPMEDRKSTRLNSSH